MSPVRIVRCGLSIALLLVITTLGEAAGELTRRQIEIIDTQIIPAQREGHPVKILSSLARLLAGISTDQVAAADQILAAARASSVAELLANARLALIASPAQRRAPRPKPLEVSLALPLIKQRIDRVAAAVAADRLMGPILPRPVTIDEYPEIFRQIHLLDDRLVTAQRYADFAALYSRNAEGLGRQRLTADQAMALDTDFARLATDIAWQRRDLYEREIELRVQRVQDATTVLGRRGALKEKLFAVHSFDVDGILIEQFFDRDEGVKTGRLSRPRLKDDELSKRVKRLVEQGRKDAGDLLAKSRMLYGGLSWWLRGRYGQTHPTGGWLKSTDLPWDDEITRPCTPIELMPRVSFDPRPLAAPTGWLYMPSGKIQPTAPTDFSTAAVPLYDRRHHFTWIWESGRFFWSYNRYCSTAAYESETPRSYAGCGSPAWMTPIRRDLDSYTVDTLVARLVIRDPATVNRLVGYDEYRQAIMLLESLVRRSTPEEIEVYDAIVKSYDDYGVYTNLSRMVEKEQTALNEGPAKPQDDFRRHGLDWVMALARVELAAMLATFTRTGRPFESLAPAPFERRAYLELLRDGARTHYWALRNDPNAARIVRTTADERLLAYGNRLTLARKFIRAAARAGKSIDTPQQRQTWKQWDEDLAEVHFAILTKINWILTDKIVATSGNRSVRDSWTTQLRRNPALADALLDCRNSTARAATAANGSRAQSGVSGR
jgi:hypothetical protein